MTTMEAPLSLKTKLPDVLATVQLERYVTDAAGNHVRRRTRCPVICNENDAELACKLYEEFNDICQDTRLDLNTGALKFEFFRQCLAGAARAHWDVAAAAQGGTTLANFDGAVVAWFAQYFEPTALHDQKQYFIQATKAYSMSVKDTATRVDEIIRFMRFMPGAPAAGTEIFSDVEKKMLLYRLMRPSWKTNFDASGNNITDAGYTWNMLIAYMSAQERRENKHPLLGGSSSQHRNRHGGQYGGRGFYGGRGMQGRGGRGFGRGGFGRGFGRGGYGRGGFGYGPRAVPYHPYGRGPIGYGYGHTGYGYGANAFYPPMGRGVIPRGGGGFGRGRARGRGREAGALHNDPGFAARPTRTLRSGGAYVADTADDAPAPAPAATGGSFESAGSSSQESAQPDFPQEDMFLGQDHAGLPEGGFAHEFDEFGFGYGDVCEGYGDY